MSGSIVGSGAGAVPRHRTGSRLPRGTGRTRHHHPLAGEPGVRPQVGDCACDLDLRWRARCTLMANASEPEKPFDGAMMNRTALPSETLVRGVPGRFRGPFARWPRTADAVLAAAMLLAAVFVEEAPGDALRIRPITDVPVPVLLLYAVAGAALYWRGREPVAVVSVALVAWGPTLGSSYSTSGGIVIVALYSVGRYAADTRRSRLCTAAAIAAAVAAVVIDGLLNSVPWGTSASAPWSCSGPGTSVAVCGCVRSAPPDSARSRPPRRAGSSPRSAPTSPANCTTWSPTG